MVANRNFADYTGAILIEPPIYASGIQTFSIGTPDTIMPGWCVTQDGEPEGSCTNLNSGDSSVIGVVLDSEAAPLDVAIPGGTKVSVAMRGSGALVWVLFNGQTAVNPGTECRAMDNDLGIVGSSAGSNKGIGIITEYAAADVGYYNPVKLRLSV